VTDPETLLHRADVAMYAAKAHGKAQVQVFGPSFLRGDRCRNVVDRAVAASTDGPTAAGGSRGGAC
jgi:predicted signal transduction protein with EAL and GGDEF domain